MNNKPMILRGRPHGKWRLLEPELNAESHPGRPRGEWPELNPVGDAFAPETVAAVRALASVAEVRTRYAESRRETPSNPGSVQSSSGENRIRFRLHNQRDFDAFEAALQQLADIEWTGQGAGPDEDPE